MQALTRIRKGVSERLHHTNTDKDATGTKAGRNEDEVVPEQPPQSSEANEENVDGIFAANHRGLEGENEVDLEMDKQALDATGPHFRPPNPLRIIRARRSPDTQTNERKTVTSDTKVPIERKDQRPEQNNVSKDKEDEGTGSSGKEKSKVVENKQDANTSNHVTVTEILEHKSKGTLHTVDPKKKQQIADLEKRIKELEASLGITATHAEAIECDSEEMQNEEILSLTKYEQGLRSTLEQKQELENLKQSMKQNPTSQPPPPQDPAEKMD